MADINIHLEKLDRYKIIVAGLEEKKLKQSKNLDPYSKSSTSALENAQVGEQCRRITNF